MAFTPATNDGITISNNIRIMENAYCSVSFADDYLALRGRQEENDWHMLNDAAKQGHIIIATEYIDKRFTFKGQKLQSTSQQDPSGGFYQVLQFPRQNITDRDGVDLSSSIPYVLMAATVEYAIRSVLGILEQDHPGTISGRTGDTTIDRTSSTTAVTTAGSLKLEKYDDVEFEYFPEGERTSHLEYHLDNSSTSPDIHLINPYPEADLLLKDLISEDVTNIRESRFLKVIR